MSTFRFGSHLPVLIKVMEKTNGEVLELGSGLYSTIYLHWACFDKKRKLLTLENKKNYYEQLRKLANDHHTIKLVDDWGKINLKGNWSVVLVDHSPGYRRGIDLPEFKDAEYVVCHDSQASSYGYDFSLFKYRFVYTPEPSYIPQTTVVSNIHSLEGLMDD